MKNGKCCHIRDPQTLGRTWKEDGEPLWCVDEMILPQKLIDVLERIATELEDSDDETGEQEYAADSSSDED